MSTLSVSTILVWERFSEASGAGSHQHHFIIVTTASITTIKASDAGWPLKLGLALSRKREWVLWC